MTLGFSPEKRLNKAYKPILQAIYEGDSYFRNLSDTQLKEETKKLRLRALDPKLMDKKIISDSFALIREVSTRSLGLKHYETQLIGGLILNDGKIAEMKTGEGKTLVATAPAFVNALTGKGVHIVTVNDYLAQRDSEWMGQVYRSLGLEVGLVHEKMGDSLRKKNYKKDITYLTNSELGFDFLRDNLVVDINSVVQRPLHYCIVDEVDSILIDEARTPLIISGPDQIPWFKVFKANEVVTYLEPNLHFILDQKEKRISFTEKGLKKTQALLKIDDIYNVNNPWIPYVLNALKAKYLHTLDQDYIVNNNAICIVDKFTGRLMEGRKWGEGLHQAIEAKEGICSVQGTTTLTSITYQSFFRMYPKMAGMTGTAKTEKLEFETVYNLLVSVVPTAQPIIRKDLADVIYPNQTSKWKAIAGECVKRYKKGQPVLVGTTTIQNSETLSSLLKDYDVPHRLLNAKPENVKKETEIIAQAGCIKTITIATNMAARGTDILLGGNPEIQAKQKIFLLLTKLIEIRQIKSFDTLDPAVEDQLISLMVDYKDFELFGISYQNFKESISRIRKHPFLSNKLKEEAEFDNLMGVITRPKQLFNSFTKLIYDVYSSLLKIYKKKCLKEKEKVKKIGGLYVIGTERHDSRRIDNQLRGRAGRQGDPGSSKFFLSLDDSLLKYFGGPAIEGLAKFLDFSDGKIEDPSISKKLDSAQRKIEGYYYSQRYSLNKYDKILHKQRVDVYRFRNKVLRCTNCRDILIELGESFIDELLLELDKLKNTSLLPGNNYHFLNTLLLNSINFSLEEISLENKKQLKKTLYIALWSRYEQQEIQFSLVDKLLLNNYQKFIFLKDIDSFWSKHLENMNFLIDSVSWQAYAQKDPFIIYEKESNVLLMLGFRNCRNLTFFDVVGSTILF